MRISDLVVGHTVKVRLPLASAAIRQTKGNPPRDYLAAVFTDGTELLDGKIWNYSSATPPETAKCYDIEGQIGEFQGKKQITISAMRLSADQDMLEFQPVYCDNAEEVYNSSLRMISDIQHDELQLLVSTIYAELRDKIIASSSAKSVHHSGYGGNITHTCEVAGLTTAICNTLNCCGYGVSKDLALSGALLHDIGKLETYTVDGASIVFTQPGMMLDHIVLGIKLVDEVGKRLGISEKVLMAVEHIIASHHGEQQYGSPTNPLFMEAYIVNYADGISATLDTLRAANKKAIAEGRPLTDRLFTLHNREHIIQNQILD